MSFGVYTYELKLTPLRVPDGNAWEFAGWLSEQVQTDGYWGESDHFGPIDWDHMMELVDEYCGGRPEAEREAVLVWVDSLPWVAGVGQDNDIGRCVELWFEY